MPNRLRVSLKGDRIPWEALASASHDLHATVHLLDRSLSGGSTLQWIITDLSLNSATVEVSPEPVRRDTPDLSGEIISYLVNGIRQVDQGTERPAFFSDEILVKVKRVTDTINHLVTGIVVEGYVNGSRNSTVLTQRVAANVDEIVGGQTTAYGSVEGLLEVISIHRGVHFDIYDTLTKRKVHCICDWELLSELKDQMGTRILVAGEIRYNNSGLPTSIKADSYKTLRLSEELPQARDIEGLLADHNFVRSDQLRDYLRGEDG